MALGKGVLHYRERILYVLGTCIGFQRDLETECRLDTSVAIWPNGREAMGLGGKRNFRAKQLATRGREESTFDPSTK